MQDRSLTTRIAEALNDRGTIQKTLRSLDSVCDLVFVGGQTMDYAPLSMVSSLRPAARYTIPHQCKHIRHITSTCFCDLSSTSGLIFDQQLLKSRKPPIFLRMIIYDPHSTTGWLNKLRPKTTSYKTRRPAYGDPTGCMHGTHVSVLETQESWASAEQGARVYWPAEMTGVGMSTITHSLCEFFGQTAGARGQFLLVPSLRESQ